MDRALRWSAVAFVTCRKGGAMLIGGSLAMLVLATAGGGMVTNYGWREAQREEIDGALRAGILRPPTSCRET